MLKKSFKKKWIAALRSGKFEQTSGELRSKDGKGFCCLGVACHLLRPNLWSKKEDVFKIRMKHGFNEKDSLVLDLPDTFPAFQAGYMPKRLAESVGLSTEDQKTLSTLNDDGNSFDEIADYIEEKL